MEINVTADDIKMSAKLFDYGNNKEAKQITDEEISVLIEKIKTQILNWLKDINLEIGAEYNIERYIILETVIALALSNYNDNSKTYIEALKLERDRFASMIEKNAKKFATSRSIPKMPSLNKGNIFH